MAPVSRCLLPIYALRDREIGKRTKELLLYVQNLLKENIASDPADIKLKNTSVYGCLVDGNEVILQTANPCGLQRWDSSFSRLEKNCVLDGMNHWARKIFLTEDSKVVCLGFDNDENDCPSSSMGCLSKKMIVKIVSLHTDDPEVSFSMTGQVSAIAVLGNRIFAKLDHENKIAEWDLEGNCIQKISIIRRHRSLNFYNPGTNYHGLFGSETSLILVEGRSVMFFDNQIERMVPLQLPSDPSGKKPYLHPATSHAAINDVWAVWAFSNIALHTEPFCCALGLNCQAAQQRHYLSAVCEKQGGIEKMILQEDWAYLADSTGRILALDLREQRYYILEKKHSTKVAFFSLDQGILATGSKSPPEIKFWDLETRAFLNQLDLPEEDELNDLIFRDGKAFVALRSGLWVIDYAQGWRKRKEPLQGRS